MKKLHLLKLFSAIFLMQNIWATTDINKISKENYYVELVYKVSNNELLKSYRLLPGSTPLSDIANEKHDNKYPYIKINIKINKGKGSNIIPMNDMSYDKESINLTLFKDKDKKTTLHTYLQSIKNLTLYESVETAVNKRLTHFVNTTNKLRRDLETEQEEKNKLVANAVGEQHKRMQIQDKLYFIKAFMRCSKSEEENNIIEDEVKLGLLFKVSDIPKQNKEGHTYDTICFKVQKDQEKPTNEDIYTLHELEHNKYYNMVSFSIENLEAKKNDIIYNILDKIKLVDLKVPHGSSLKIDYSNNLSIYNSLTECIKKAFIKKAFKSDKENELYWPWYLGAFAVILFVFFAGKQQEKYKDSSKAPLVDYEEEDYTYTENNDW